MKISILSLLFLVTFQIALAGKWPMEIKGKGGALITIYQPQPETMKGNLLTGRSAFSAKAKTQDELVFGVFWFSATLGTDRDSRLANLESITITNIKLPGISDTTKLKQLKLLLESELPKQGITASIDEIISTLEQEQAVNTVDLKNEAPSILYTTKSSTLVLIDGEPKLQEDKDLKMKRVINTAFLILENPDDKKYYLYGGQFWYNSSSLKEGYQPVSKLSKSIAAVDAQLKKEQKGTDANAAKNPPSLLVSTVPAELIQSKGEADFVNIQGTELLYVTNSEDDIFKSINDQNYYILLSGRWYSARKLEGPWTFIAADKLPADFSKIPEGSAKDNVLASVAGTQASKDAVMDAQVPQTAKVDRTTAKCTVTYDGEPKFEKIEGTSMELAMNTGSTVIKSEGKYYCVETGVWFIADAATGPWKVSDTRPKDVNKIPASSPAHNTQYVYIYDSTPQVVYVGYTPGYMGCYVYGSTVVYGTGYYYSPWYGPYYYPRPATYGFSMHYNPWTGWSMGFHYSTGFFTFSAYGHPGYWGPPMYRPPYYPPYHGGMYGGRGPTYINGDVNINVGNSNNIYNKRNDVTTSDVKRGQGNLNNKPATTDKRNAAQSARGTAQPATQPKNNVYSDRDGNVYQRKDNGSWDQRDGNQWKSNTQQKQNMDKDFQNRQRSAQQNNGFQQMNQGGNLGGANRGGGGRSGGGGGGRRR